MRTLKYTNNDSGQTDANGLTFSSDKGARTGLLKYINEKSILPVEDFCKSANIRNIYMDANTFAPIQHDYFCNFNYSGTITLVGNVTNISNYIIKDQNRPTDTSVQPNHEYSIFPAI